MARRTLTLIALAMVVASLGPAAESRARGSFKGLVPGISLQRVGTIGDYPPADETIVVNVNAEGILTVDGKRVSFDALTEHLAERAETSRCPQPPYASKWHLVIRLDRTLPWGAAQWILQACYHPDVRIPLIQFAVLPEQGGEEEGTLAVHFDAERGLAAVRPRPVPFRVLAEGAGSDPMALYERMHGRLASVCALSGDAHVPVGYMLRVLDSLIRAGAGDIWFRGWPPESGEHALAKLMREARTKDLAPTVSVFGQTIGPAPGADASAPAVTRVRGAFAGIVKPKGANRDGSTRRFGRMIVASGTGAKSEAAVDLALDWLSRHQDPKGSWDCDGFENRCTSGKCGGIGAAPHDVGVTGLALLAFLGAGQVPGTGKYGKAVESGVEYLKRVQDADGCFGPRTSTRFVYNHAIATLAMVEAWVLTGGRKYGRSVRSAIAFSEKCRNPGMAWRYGVRPGDNDTSVTAWMGLAVLSFEDAFARLRGVRAGMRAWLDTVTDPESGRVGYRERGGRSFREPERLEAFPPVRSEALTAAGMLIRIYSSDEWSLSEATRKGAVLCAKLPPRWDAGDGSIDMCYWYFGSMAMFQVGGDSWKAWNAAMKAAIIPHQRKDGDRRGSWDPVGPWGRQGGRVYSTALMTMCLETYYRHGRVHPDEE